MTTVVVEKEKEMDMSISCIHTVMILCFYTD
jgi:hypothetical protein